MDFVNKRSFIRVNVNMPATVQSEDPSMGQIQAQVLNISVEGMFLMSEGISLSVGQIIKIGLSGEWRNTVITARVVRQEKHRFACQFVDLSRETGKALDEGIYKLWRQNVRIKPKGKNIEAKIPHGQLMIQGLNVFI